MGRDPLRRLKGERESQRELRNAEREREREGVGGVGRERERREKREGGTKGGMEGEKKERCAVDFVLVYLLA